MARVLVVGDEESFSDALSYMLRKEGFEVSVAPTGTSALTQFDRTGADIVLLDLMLPEMSGTEVCRQIRQRSAVPIIMVTARDSEIDKVVGLEIGADDYVTKPFNPRELLARVRSVLRRATRGGADPATMGREVQMGKCRLNLDTRKLYEADGMEVPLTAMEFDLLKCFAEHPRRALSRDQLLDLAHSKEMEPFDRSIDTRIARIRRKIERDPAKPSCLKTVRAVGYVFNPEG